MRSTLKTNFTKTEIDELFRWKEHRTNRRTRKKMSVLYLKSQNLTHKEIKRLERVSECIDKLKTEYKEELSGLMTLNFQTFKDIQVMAR